ncbi:MAG: hypothetical protein ABIV47_00900 [Roseiflexaceae bacterium]
MSSSTRAFLLVALFALPCAAVLHLLALLGVLGAWPAMVHLTMFGWITAMIMAVNYHTLPVFSARDFPYPALIWGHWALSSVGVALASGGLLAGWGAGTSAGLLLQVGGALIFVGNTMLLFLRGAPRPQRHPTPPIAGQIQVDHIGAGATTAAGICLPLALLLLLAAQLGGFSGQWVLAAEHLATLGWIMLMIVGVAYHTLPRFSGCGTRGPAWVRAQLLSHGAALALIVLALGFGWSAGFALGGFLMALALGLFAWTIWPTLRTIQPQLTLHVLAVKEHAR